LKKKTLNYFSKSQPLKPENQKVLIMNHNWEKERDIKLARF